MIIKTIYGANRITPHTFERACARGIVVSNGKILLSYIPESDFYMTPGGGHELGETLFECCIREICEETGYVVEPKTETPFFVLNEFYKQNKFINNFFICSITGNRTAIKLTFFENSQKMVMKWLDLDEAFEVFARYEDHALINPDKRCSYLRDYTALKLSQTLGHI